MAKEKIKVQDIEISIYKKGNESFVSLTDMLKTKKGQAQDYIKNWLRNNATVLFLGTWEYLHNGDFKKGVYNQIKSDYLRNDYLMTVKKWIELTSAIGIEAKAGRYGGTYAHSDIAIHFANWLSPEFYVYIVKEFQELKVAEASSLQQEWNVNRYLSKVNYSIHNDYIRSELVPGMLTGTKKEITFFASEADLLNEVVFGRTAKQWRLANPDKKGNMRDHASTEQLHVLANVEVLNAELIDLGFEKDERRIRLFKAANRHTHIIQDQERKRLK